MSRSSFDAKRLAAILVGGGVLFIAVGAYVISRQSLPPTFLGAPPTPFVRPAPALTEHPAQADAGTVHLGP